MSINILMIAAEFPPLNTGGSYRPYYFAKHLVDYGINPTIITIDMYKDSKNINYELLTKLPKSIKIEKIPCDYNRLGYKNKIINQLYHFFKTDDLWSRSIQLYVAKNLDRIISENHINISYITIPPFSIPRSFIGRLKKKKLPIILDMRDHYSLWGVSSFATYGHYLKVYYTEKFYLKNATLIIVVSNQMRDDLLKLHSNLPPSKIIVIPNGNEEEILMNNIENVTIDEKDKIIIGYSGAFYYNPIMREIAFQPWWKRKGLKKFYYSPRKEDWLYRSPYFFFKTLHGLFLKEPDLKRRIEFQFAGQEPEWLKKQLTMFDLQNNYKYVGYLNSVQLKEFHQSCDAFLVTSAKVINGKDYCIASKTFSYLEAGKPILGFVTEGEQKSMLENTGISYIFDADNNIENIEKLKYFFTVKMNFNFNQNINKTFVRKTQTGFLASQILKLNEKNNNGSWRTTSIY